MNKTFKKHDDAVSPVVGIILMVAITVIVAANVAIFVFGINPTSTPQASVKITSTSPAYVKLDHQGGSDIILSYARIIVEQGANRIIYDPAGNASSRLTVGDRMQVNTETPGISINGNAAEYIKSGGSPFIIISGSDVTVTMIDIPSGNQVAALKITA
jgi:FlaG/FlaF family flagellin (archaellin)